MSAHSHPVVGSYEQKSYVRWAMDYVGQVKISQQAQKLNLPYTISLILSFLRKI